MDLVARIPPPLPGTGNWFPITGRFLSVLERCGKVMVHPVNRSTSPTKRETGSAGTDTTPVSGDGLLAGPPNLIRLQTGHSPDVSTVLRRHFKPPTWRWERTAGKARLPQQGTIVAFTGRRHMLAFERRFQSRLSVILGRASGVSAGRNRGALDASNGKYRQDWKQHLVRASSFISTGIPPACKPPEL